MSTQKNTGRIEAYALFIILLLATMQSCQKTELSHSPSASQGTEAKLSAQNDWMQVNLDADVEEEYDPVFIDPNLVNAWGMSFDDEGEIWVSAAETGVSVIYNANGETIEGPVNIPFG